MPTAQPFRIDIPQEKLDAIMARVKAYDWFPAPANEEGFAYGMSTPVMKDIQRYWIAGYDWRKSEEILNKYPSYKVEILSLIHI